MVAPLDTDVAPSSDVPGSSVTSAARSTPACTQVVAGSTTVTPSAIQRCQDPSVQLRAPLRELDPVVDALGLQVVVEDAGAHPASDGRAYATTSVRYSSPLALRGLQAGQPSAERGCVEDVDAGVDLGEVELGVVGVRLLDDAGHLPSPSRTIRP